MHQCLEALLLLETRDALWAGLEVESERSFNSDLPKTKVGCRKDLANDCLLFALVLLYYARVSVLETGEDLDDVLGAVEWDLPTFVAKALAHWHPEGRRVD